MGGLLALIGFVGLVLGLFALVRGRLNWARLRNRKQAAVAAAASFVVFIIGALNLPHTDNHRGRQRPSDVTRRWPHQ